jgi:hypothetical protein
LSYLAAAEERLLIEDISDDALEAVAFADSGPAANFTLNFCTAVDLCPGP